MNRRVWLVALALPGAAAAAPVDESDEAAVALGYRHDTARVDARKYPQHTKEQRCMNCQFWQGTPNDAWAGCAMFGRKQIAAAGWCLAYKKA